MIKTYYRPGDLGDALKKKLDNPDAVYLAGGTQINRAPLNREEAGTAIDIRDVVSAGIVHEGTNVIIGALTSLQELAESEIVPSALREASGLIPSRNIRNQATVGGNIGAGRSDSLILPVLIALAAGVRTVPGHISVEEYVQEELDELILEIHIPVPAVHCIVVRESRSSASLPVVSAAVSLAVDKKLPNDGFSGACVAVGCVAPKIIRLTEVEKAIVSGNLNTRADAEIAVRGAIRPVADILGSAEYKIYINGVVIADALMRCQEVTS